MYLLCYDIRIFLKDSSRLVHCNVLKVEYEMEVCAQEE
jgi:hypothetical protein